MNRLRACVDIGGTKVAVTLAWGEALLGATRCAEPTARSGPPGALADQVLRLLDQALRIAAGPGMRARARSASAGRDRRFGLRPVVLAQGQVELAAPNICGGLAGPARGLPNDWTSAPLEAPLRARWPGVAIRVENDATAALEAERLWGALRGLDHCAYLTWSTGIGVGLCVGRADLARQERQRGPRGPHVCRGRRQPGPVWLRQPRRCRSAGRRQRGAAALWAGTPLR